VTRVSNQEITIEMHQSSAYVETVDMEIYMEVYGDELKTSKLEIKVVEV